MRAAVTRETGSIAVEDIDRPEPGPDEVLVRVAAVGLCRSDLSVLDGHGFGPPLPLVLGHEGAGVVEAVGPGVRTAAVGDHVVCSIVTSCGTCWQCRSGSPSLCEVGTRAAFGGGMMDFTSRLHRGEETISQIFCQSSFAEYAVVPASGAVVVDPAIALDVAASLGCGATTGIGAVIRRAQVTPMSSVVVVGTGGVGLAAVMAARVVGAGVVIGVDTSAAARELAMDLGATAVLTGPGFAEGVIAATGRGADYVIDTVGTPATLAESVAATRPGGEVVLVGLADATAQVTLPMFELCLQKRVTGTYSGSVAPHLDIPRAVALHLDGRLPLDRLVTQRYELADIATAFEDLRAGRTRGRSVIVLDHP